jgi:phosphate butyryltransferase
MVMKGHLDSGEFLKAILNKEFGLRGQLLSQVLLYEIQGFDRMLLLSDCAININPSREDKIVILKNAVNVAHALGCDLPNAAFICATEKLNPKMPETVDAFEIAEMYRRGEIKGCSVSGPLGLDNAISIDAAKHKSISDPNAGKANILIMPNLCTGNIFNKSLEYFTRCHKAGTVIGAKIPVVLTSRASSKESKFNSICLSAMCANLAKENK